MLRDSYWCVTATDRDASLAGRWIGFRAAGRAVRIAFDRSAVAAGGLVLLPDAAGVPGLHATCTHGRGRISLGADRRAAWIALDCLIIAAGLLVHLLRRRLLRACYGNPADKRRGC